MYEMSLIYYGGDVYDVFIIITDVMVSVISASLHYFRRDHGTITPCAGIRTDSAGHIPRTYRPGQFPLPFNMHGVGNSPSTITIAPIYTVFQKHITTFSTIS